MTETDAFQQAFKIRKSPAFDMIYDADNLSDYRNAVLELKSLALPYESTVRDEKALNPSWSPKKDYPATISPLSWAYVRDWSVNALDAVIEAEQMLKRGQAPFQLRSKGLMGWSDIPPQSKLIWLAALIGGAWYFIFKD